MKKFKVLSIFLAVIMLAGMVFAETPSTLKRNVWNAKQTFKHGVEITGTGDITATNIADPERNVNFDLRAAYINDASGVLGSLISNSDPYLGLVDGIPAIVYKSSGVTTSIGYSFIVPDTYTTGLGFRVMVSSSSDTSYASMGLDWQLWVNKSSTAFDAAPFEQTAVYNTVSTPSASNVLLTFTADATALAGIAAGDAVTLWLWNADTRTEGTADTAKTTEIKAISGFFTSTM